MAELTSIRRACFRVRIVCGRIAIGLPNLSPVQLRASIISRPGRALRERWSDTPTHQLISEMADDGVHMMADPAKAISEIDAIRQEGILSSLFVGAALLFGAAAARSHARTTWIASGGAARHGDAAGASRTN